MVFVFIEYYKSTYFFLNLSKSDKERKYIFLTHSPSSYFTLKLAGERVYFVSHLFSCRCYHNFSLKNITALELGFSRENPSRKLIQAYIDRFRYIVADFDMFDNDIFIMTWNGETIPGRAARLIKKNSSELNVYLGFFEIANISGKIFVDPEGVNKTSSIYSNINVLKDLPEVNDLFHNDWVKNFYIASKTSKKTKVAWSFPFYLKVLDFIYFVVSGVRYFPLDKGFKIKISRRCQFKNSISSPFDGTDGKAIYPFQVRTDSQLVLNSKYNNISGLQKALDTFDGKIIVTAHPHDKSAICEIDNMDENYKKRTFISNESTFSLIAMVDHVFVNNSTVGLDALVLGKDVTFFGESFYSLLDQDLLKKYIHHYLVDYEFNSNDLFTKNSVKKIFSLLKKDL